MALTGYCVVAVMPNAADSDPAWSKLRLNLAKGRALGALLEVSSRWCLCVVLCVISLCAAGDDGFLKEAPAAAKTQITPPTTPKHAPGALS